MKIRALSTLHSLLSTPYSPLPTLHSLLSTLYTLPHAEHLSPRLAGMFDCAPSGLVILLITLVGRCPTLRDGAPSGLVQVLMSPTHLGKRLSKAYEFALHHSIPAGLPKRLKIRALSTLHSLLSTLYTLPHAEHLSPSLAGMFDSAPSGLADAVDRVGWAMPNPERWRPFRACTGVDLPWAKG